MFVARVELIGGDKSDLYASGVRADVKQVLQGPPLAKVVVRLREQSDCDYPFENGRSGFLVGKLEPGGGNTSVVVPVMTPVYLERYKIPEAYRR